MEARIDVVRKHVKEVINNGKWKTDPEYKKYKKWDLLDMLDSVEINLMLKY